MTSVKLLLSYSVLTVSCLAETWTGTLVDVMCKGKDLSTHTAKCATMPGCAKSGFGVVLPDGKFLKFDEAGNSMALRRLKSPDVKEKDLKAKIDGTLDGEVIKVSAFQLQ